MTALEYIQQKQIAHKMQSGQIVLKACPFCPDEKGHLYMDPGEGAFFCHKCNTKGNLITFQKHLGDYQRPEREPMHKFQSTKQHGAVKPAFEEKPKAFHAPDEKAVLQAHERLLSDAEGLRYITETRGIGMETVKAFKIGLSVDKSGGRWLTIPHYEGGKVVNVKSRSLPPAEKTFRRVKDCKSILFNNDVIDGADDLFLCEGEIDALTLINAGVKGAVGVTTGAGSFDPEWVDQLKKVKRIFICYDPDEAGQKGAREVARRLGYGRCWNVVLPDGQDVNEFFQAGHDIFDFQKHVTNARQFDVAGVMTLVDGLQNYLKEIQNPEQATGIRTGWPDVDRLVKTGLQPGELVIVSAPPKIGKSTLTLQMISHNAMAGNPSLFFSLEMRPMKVIEKVVKCHIRSAEIGPPDIHKTRIDFAGKPLYFGYCYQKPTLDGIMATLREAIQRYGLKLVCFDHLHFLCRSITNQVQEIGLAVQAFKLLAEELEVPILLIAQPRKIQADAIMTAMDLKDSSSIFSDCDHLIILHRARRRGDGNELATEAFEPETLVRIEASRYNSGGECLLYFHGAYSRFDEIVKEWRR